MRAYEPLFFRCSPKISARWCSAPIVGKNPTCRFGASALPIRTDISPLLSWKSTASSDCRAIIPGLSVSEGTSLGPYLLNSRSAQAEWGKCTAQWIHAAAYSLGHGLCVPTNVVLNSLKREGRDRKGKIPGSLSQTLAVPPTLCRGHAFYLWFRDRTQEALALWRSPHGLEAGTDIPWSVPRRIAPARRDSQRTAFQGRAARRATIGIRDWALLPARTPLPNGSQVRDSSPDIREGNTHRMPECAFLQRSSPSYVCVHCPAACSSGDPDKPGRVR